MKTISFFFLTALLLLTTSTFLTLARDGSVHADPKPTKGKPVANKGTGNTNGKGNGNGGGIGGFFGPGGGFGIPGNGNGNGNGWGNIGGGYGSGYGGPNGGFGRGGVIRPTVVCKERGPCYKKKLTCPAKCFTSYSRSGKNYGAGGGGGGCTMDCKKKCVAFC